MSSGRSAAVPPASTTPMMRQYWSIKRRYPGTILLFRLGDFYETFGEDAVTTSQVLGIALTSRGNDVPLAGIPFHSAQPYIDRLVAAGHKVAICEQLEDPASAKGIVRRDVVRVITPGTVLSEGLLDAGRPNYLVALNPRRPLWGLAAVDVTSGEFLATELPPEEVGEELTRLSPAEIILPSWCREDPGVTQALSALSHAVVEPREDWMFDPETSAELLTGHFRTVGLEAFGLAELPAATGAAGAILHYLRETQKSNLGHLRGIRVYRKQEFMYLDRATRRNLELVDPLDPDDKDVTLLSALDKTCTRMGRRLLRRWILEPLLDVDAIQQRLDAVEALVRDDVRRRRLRDHLERMADVERLVGRIGCGAASPRDMVALASSLEQVAKVRELLAGYGVSLLSQVAAQLEGEAELVAEIRRVLVDHPPAGTRAGGYVRHGCDPLLDELRAASKEGKAWLAQLQQREREATGIPSLKVGYSKVFGFYLEVTKPHLGRVPAHYQRKQTVANAERFFTAELKEKEALILGAEERAVAREEELLATLVGWVSERLSTLRAMAQGLALVDVLQSLAEVARQRSYCRPTVDSSSRIVLVKSRHPVVECVSGEPFMPNDVLLDTEEHQIILLTGPNMAGKSTYLRQVALIVIMAQMGSFVPAQSAHVGLVDRIFTRVGATDRLARGQSTFLVEMVETATILHHATSRSLVLLDEIGRGTSTYDGISIAWAVVEELHQGRVRPRTIFATHYHELVELERDYPRIATFNVSVRREGDRVVFLHRVERGASNRSFGIEVARLAGLPKSVLDRASHLLRSLEQQRVCPVSPRRRPRGAQQLELFSPPQDPLRARLASVVVEETTPLEALRILHELKRMAKEEAHGQDQAP